MNPKCVNPPARYNKMVYVYIVDYGPTINQYMIINMIQI